MKYHAFLMQVHTEPDLVRAIINKLDAPNHYFFIHVDRKTINFDSFLKLEKSNVIVSKERYIVRWGSFEQIQLTLLLIRLAVEYGIDFDYYHLTSGQDYPVKDNHSFDEFFESTDKSFMELLPDVNVSRRYLYYHLNSFCNVHCRLGAWLDNKFVLIQNIFGPVTGTRRQIPIKVYKGCNWWSLHKKVVMAVYSYIKEHPEFIRRFRNTYCCDEVFFHTIVFNGPYRDSIVLDCLRYVDWKKKNEGDSLPRILREDDYEMIVSSGCIFARKVSMDDSLKLIKLLG